MQKRKWTVWWPEQFKFLVEGHSFRWTHSLAEADEIARSMGGVVADADVLCEEMNIAQRDAVLSLVGAPLGGGE